MKIGRTSSVLTRTLMAGCCVALAGLFMGQDGCPPGASMVLTYECPDHSKNAIWHEASGSGQITVTLTPQSSDMDVRFDLVVDGSMVSGSGTDLYGPGHVETRTWDLDVYESFAVRTTADPGTALLEVQGITLDETSLEIKDFGCN